MTRRRWLTRARVPIRARLTIAFAAVIAVVLAAVGVFLFTQFRRDLDTQINGALRTQARALTALVAEDGPVAVRGSGVRLAQVYGLDGRVLSSTREVAHRRLLTAREAMQATLGAQTIPRRPLRPYAVRIRAVPARAGETGPQLVGAVAVAESLRLRDHELGHLRSLLLTAGPLALLLASLAGYEVARAALAPVDLMRARSERITERQLSERLPVPASGDEIAALGRTLNAMLDRIEAAVASERRLVGDASHELRTPLTTLRAEIDLALLGDRDPAELRAALQSASEEARRLSRLADDLLVLARADQGRLPLHPEPLAPCDLLEAAAARARAAAGARGRAIVVLADAARGSEVLADRDRVAQALDNLVANALRYGQGTIALSARDDGDLVELHVTDEGRGFPDELLGREFERFRRGSDTRASEPGSGLGLALVEALAVAHGGHARAGNRPEGGADVAISLPRAYPTSRGGWSGGRSR